MIQGMKSHAVQPHFSKEELLKRASLPTSAVEQLPPTRTVAQEIAPRRGSLMSGQN